MGYIRKKTGRIPIVPDDFKNKSEHIDKEILMDYVNNNLYILRDGEYINITGRIMDSIQQIQDGTSVIHICTEDTLPNIQDRRKNHWYLVVTDTTEYGNNDTSISKINYIYYGLIEETYINNGNYLLIAQNFNDNPDIVPMTIPEGYTLEQIAQTVGQLQGEFKEPLTADAFLAKAQDETFISQLVAKYPNLLGSLPTKDSGVRYRLEGYLFPATYTIKESTTVESLIDEMVAAMDKAMSPYYATIKEKNLTVNELLSIASLVEKEGAKTEDRKKIAGVFYNRLNLGMPLQSNIAILYAQGKLGQKISLADDAAIDTNIDSPYNVYTHLGLMPGPVDSPSLDAIEASVNQTKSDYLYFVANVEDGKVYFATTKEEHDQNVAEHINSKLTQSSSSN